MISKNIQTTEQKISNILFYICLFITLLALGMTLVRFFTRGEFPPTNIGTFYIGILLIYSIHKEALRWIIDKKEQKRRPGESFVYIWIIITAFLYLINFISKDYFRFDASGEELHVLTEATLISLEVGAVFILARTLKLLSFVFPRK